MDLSSFFFFFLVRGGGGGVGVVGGICNLVVVYKPASEIAFILLSSKECAGSMNCLVE